MQFADFETYVQNLPFNQTQADSLLTTQQYLLEFTCWKSLILSNDEPSHMQT